MKQRALALAAGIWLVGASPALAQPDPDDVRRDLDLVELRLRVKGLEAQVQRLSELLQAHLADREPPGLPDPAAPIPRVAPDGELPPAYQVPGYPWLRVEDGVLYLQPVPIAGELAAQLVTPQGLGQVLEGAEIRWDAEGATVGPLPPEHPLALYLGVRPGDRLRTLNEHPLPRTAAQRAQLAQALQGQRRFALELLRGPQRVIVAFYVAPEAATPAPLEPVTLGLEQRYRLILASQNPGQPGRSSVVLQEVAGSRAQLTLFVGDALEDFVVEAIQIVREGDEAHATLTLRDEEGRERFLRLRRAP